jgi:hypothetical protein
LSIENKLFPFIRVPPEQLALLVHLDQEEIVVKLDHPESLDHPVKWANLDRLVCKDLPVKTVRPDLRETRVIRVSLDFRVSLDQLDHLAKRVLLEMTDSLANLVSQVLRVRLEMTATLELLDSLVLRAQGVLREKKVSGVHLERRDPQARLDLQVKERALIRQHWQQCLARATRRGLIR